MEMPKNLKLADKVLNYKTYACESCQAECVAVPVDADMRGQPQNIIVLCPKCITGFKLSVIEYRKQTGVPK